MSTNVLVGRTISAIYLADDKLAIRFSTDAGEVVANADADCCSYTWIEHVSMPALGLPCVVTAAEDVDMPDLGTPSDEDCRQYYGFKLTTDRGEILIDYRNDSNGYYGGNLSWPDEHFYGGVFGQNVSTHTWVDVKGDVI